MFEIYIYFPLFNFKKRNFVIMNLTMLFYSYLSQEKDISQEKFLKRKYVTFLCIVKYTFICQIILFLVFF